MINSQLKHLRKEAKLTQSQLAKRLSDGYSRSNVCLIEKGTRKVGLSMIEKWAEACGFEMKIVFHEKRKNKMN
jgi:transcriptional regulator with XRE-family HTH domain